MKTKYKIYVQTLQGNRLTFSVDEYTIEEGGFVCFTDRVTGYEKKFHASNCEIEQSNQGGYR